jgi:hypothetical protein
MTSKRDGFSTGHKEKMGFGVKRKVRYGLACVESLFNALSRGRHDRMPTLESLSYGRWFIDRHDTEILESGGTEELLAHADLCVRHLFNILGTGLVNWGEPINWHQDIKSKGVWPSHYYKRLRYSLTGEKGSDVKIPWELSRFQHLPLLAKAYFVSRDTRYAEEVVRQIADWITANPFQYGVNWTCAMEVAIRACNWMWAWWALKDNPLWSKEFNEKFLESLWQHGLYIEHNLEDEADIRTNHYLADVVGLLFIGVMFPRFNNAYGWREFGINQLPRCMAEMVYPDGVSFENSIGYHRLVLQFFAYSAILCNKNGIAMPKAFWERLERMFEFIMGCMRPDGRMPMIGDADDGRFFMLSNYYDCDRWDFRYLLSQGAVLFMRKDFKIAACKCHEEVFSLFGAEGIKVWQGL